jgi:hypothetical protein
MTKMYFLVDGGVLAERLVEELDEVFATISSALVGVRRLERPMRAAPAVAAPAPARNFLLVESIACQHPWAI